MNSNKTLETLWSYCEGAKLLTLAEEKKMDGFPLPHTQFKPVFVFLHYVGKHQLQPCREPIEKFAGLFQ